MYKAVRKAEDGTFFSDYDNSFTYKIGQEITEECDTNQDIDCSYGIHIAHKSWAILFGINWENSALLECRVNVEDIVVPTNCDGKVRASKIKVIREVPESEWYG
jgi:hypothetical protein